MNKFSRRERLFTNGKTRERLVNRRNVSQLVRNNSSLHLSFSLPFPPSKALIRMTNYMIGLFMKVVAFRLDLKGWVVF